jgi:hypothetical protein
MSYRTWLKFAFFLFCFSLPISVIYGADRDVTTSQVPGAGLTFAQLVESGVGSLLPRELSYKGVGVRLDKVACHWVVLDDGGVKHVHFRARYRGTLAGIGTPAVESLWFYYDSGNVRIDLGGLKGVVNTESIKNWIRGNITTGSGGQPQPSAVVFDPNAEYIIESVQEPSHVINNDTNTVGSGGKVHMMAYAENPENHWRIIHVRDDFYKIESVQEPGHVINNDTNTHGSGGKVHMMAYANNPENHWRLKRQPNGTFVIESVQEPGHVINNDTNTHGSGGKVHMMAYANNPENHWRIFLRH